MKKQPSKHLRPIRWLLHQLGHRSRDPEREIAQDSNPPQPNLQALSLTAQGDAFDLSGLYLNAIECYDQAIACEPCMSRPYRKAANSFIKLGNLLQAREYLDLAALYAGNKVERIDLLHTRYQLLAAEMAAEPCLPRLKQEFHCLNLGLREAATDIIFLGNYAIASTFAMWKLPDPHPAVLNDIHRTGLHYYRLFEEQSSIPTPYNIKYHHRLQAEILHNVSHLNPQHQESWKIAINQKAA